MADHRIRTIFQFGEKRRHARATCPGCGWSVSFPPSAILQLFPPLTPVHLAERRLRCRRCGQRGARLTSEYREYHG